MPIIRGTPELSDADLSFVARWSKAKPPEESAAAVKTTAGRLPADEQIGVIFVHGIGSQEPGETLLAWSAPIVRVVREWHLQHDIRIDPVRRSQIDFGGSTTPVVRLLLPKTTVDHKRHGRQEWLLSEAWWAQDVDPPTAGQMTNWLFGEWEFSRIINGLFNGLAEDGDTGIWVRVEQVLARLLVVPFTLLAPFLYGASSLLKYIPISALQDGLAKKQLDWFLVDWFGDVHTLIADRVQAANVRTKIAKTAAALQSLGCTRIVLVAHSGGAIASYMTLTDPLYRTGSDQPDLEMKADRLITLGEGLNLAWRLGDALGSDPPADEILSAGDLLVRDLKIDRPHLKWTDFWATHDPAPAGPLGGVGNSTWSVPARTPDSRPVRNWMSIRNDHGAYWDNDEQFVLPVVRLIETAGAAATSRFYPLPVAGIGAPPAGQPATDIRATWRRARVGRLAAWWSALLILWGAVALIGIAFAVAAGHVLDRLGSSVTEIVHVATNMSAVADQYHGLADPIAKIVALIPAPSLDVTSWLGALGPNVVGLITLLVVGWWFGKIGVGAWDAWDARARVAARRDAPTAEPGGGFSVLAFLTLAGTIILAIAAVYGGLADLHAAPRLVGGG